MISLDPDGRVTTANPAVSSILGIDVPPGRLIATGDLHDNPVHLERLVEAAALDDVRLDIPIRRAVATYMMGFSREGGYRPAAWNWTVTSASRGSK